MRTTALAFALLLASLLAAPTDSWSAASARASVSVNEGPAFVVSLDQTGFADLPGYTPPLFSYLLGPGESVDVSFSYMLSVSDDGLPLEPMNPIVPPPGFGCIVLPAPPTGPSSLYCGPPSGLDHEAASALFAVGPVTRFNPAGISFDGLSRVGLATSADSLAESLSRSGRTLIRMTNFGTAPAPVTLEAQLAVWVLASPLPEPATCLQMLGGLVLLRVLPRARVRPADRRI